MGAEAATAATGEDAAGVVEPRLALPVPAKHWNIRSKECAAVLELEKAKKKCAHERKRVRLHAVNPAPPALALIIVDRCFPLPPLRYHLGEIVSFPCQDCKLNSRDNAGIVLYVHIIWASS